MLSRQQILARGIHARGYAAGKVVNFSEAKFWRRRIRK
jgi:hypothetical protein